MIFRRVPSFLRVNPLVLCIYIVASGCWRLAAQTPGPVEPTGASQGVDTLAAAVQTEWAQEVLAVESSDPAAMPAGDGAAKPASLTDKKRPQFRYAVAFRTWLDNLEDSYDYFELPTRTIVGTTLTPMVGVQYGRHALMGGVFLYTRYGSKKFMDKVEPRIYYQYKDERFTAVAGLFSRDMLKPSRLFHYTTSFKMTNNTLHGFLGQYTTETGYLEGLIDWYLANPSRRADGFILRLSGAKRVGGWFFNGQFSYHHRADRDYFQAFNVYDRLQYDAHAGYDFGVLQSVFRSIYLSVGLSGDANQKRLGDYSLQVGLGFETEVNLDWKGLYLRNMLYIGQAQMPHYTEYGSELYFGDPFYRSAFYDRLAVGYVYKYRWVSVGAHVLLFFTDSPKIANQQLLSVAFDMDELVRPRPRLR